MIQAGERQQKARYGKISYILFMDDTLLFTSELGQSYKLF